MNYSKSIRNFAYDLISHYAKLDALSGSYHYKLKDISDFDLNELVVLIMNENDDMAFDATSPNNPWYEKKMLPALKRHLLLAPDKNEEAQFIIEWREGILNFFLNDIEELLNNAISEYNEDQGCNRSRNSYYEEGRITVW